jgi:hypothetical protein
MCGREFDMTATTRKGPGLALALYSYISRLVVTGAALPSAETHIKLTSSAIIGRLREDSPDSQDSQDSQDTVCVRMRRLLRNPHCFRCFWRCFLASKFGHAQRPAPRKLPSLRPYLAYWLEKLVYNGCFLMENFWGHPVLRARAIA